MGSRPWKNALINKLNPLRSSDPRAAEYIRSRSSCGDGFTSSAAWDEWFANEIMVPLERGMTIEFEETRYSTPDPK